MLSPTNVAFEWLAVAFCGSLSGSRWPAVAFCGFSMLFESGPKAWAMHLQLDFGAKSGLTVALGGSEWVGIGFELLGVAFFQWLGMA